MYKQTNREHEVNFKACVQLKMNRELKKSDVKE